MRYWYFNLEYARLISLLSASAVIPRICDRSSFQTIGGDPIPSVRWCHQSFTHSVWVVTSC